MAKIVWGVMVGTWAAFLISLVTQRLEVWPFWGAMFIVLTSIFKIQYSRFGENKKIGIDWIEIITMGGWSVYLVKLFSQMLVIGGDGIWAGGSNVWGDWAGHIGYIANWVYGQNWPPQNPWYAGIRLSYPFLFDYTSAILLKSGVTLDWAMQLPGIVLGIVMVGLLFRLARKIFKSSLAGSIAVAIFMLSGGLGFLYLIPGQQILAVPKDGVKELTHSYEANIQWVNFVISEMVPQRGILVGVVAALVVFGLLWEGYENKSQSKFVMAGIMAGLIPFFHAHTFMAIYAIGGFLFVIRPRKIWWYFLIPAAILALPQFGYFAPQVSDYSSGFMRLQLGWAAHVQNDNWLWFWVKNIGILSIIIPLAWIYYFKKNRKIFWVYLPFALIFVGCNIWIFQPWENDNSKLLRFWYLGSSILVGGWLSQVANKNKWGKILAAILLILITLSGAVDAGSWLDFSKNKLMMWSREEISLAEAIKSNTAKTSVFLTNDNHNHWVVDLAGRKIVMGFRGWLWSWGIDYSQRERDVRKIFEGSPETKNLIDKYGIDYVIIGPGEKSNFGANETYFDKRYPLFLETAGQKIFDVRGE